MPDANLDDLLAALREVSADSNPESVDDGEGDEEDDQGSIFNRLKPLGTVMLLQKLEEQAEFKADQDRALTVRRLRIKDPPTKLQQKSAKLMEMRRKANVVEQELNLNQKLKLETDRLQKAKVELYRSNMT